MKRIAPLLIALLIVAGVVAALAQTSTPTDVKPSVSVA